MKVELEILSKNRGVMRVNVYAITNDSRKLFCSKTGTIPEIKWQIEQDIGENVEIEKSIFQGWY